MSRPSLRDRLFTPKVVEAAASPLAIGLFGGGAAVAILAGLPILGAAAVGLGAWGIRVAAAARSGRSAGRSATKVEPFALSDPWRQYVIDAQVAKKRFDSVVNGMTQGPTQARLEAMDDRLGDGIDESWKIAQRGHEITQALRVLKTSDAERELAQLTSRTSQAPRRPRPKPACSRRSNHRSTPPIGSVPPNSPPTIDSWCSTPVSTSWSHARSR